MARLQYQRSAKSGGYRPQQVDDRNVARLKQEASRQIEGMRQAFNAEIENRREVSQTMKEDAAATSQQLQRNYEIQTQNSANRIKGLQAQASRDQQQFNIDQQANTAIFETLATLSSTAAKVVDAQQKQRENEDYERDSFTPSTIDEQIADRNTELLMRSADLNRLLGIQTAEAKNADPLAVATLKLESPVLGFDAAAGHFNQYANEQHEDSLNAFLRTAEERLKRTLTYDEKKELLGLHTSGVVALAREAGVSSRFLKRIMGTIQEKNNAFLAVERKKETDLKNELLVDKALNNVLQSDPTRRNEVFLTSYNNVASVKGHEGALDLFQTKVFTLQNPKTGKFYMTEEEIANLPFVQNGVNTTLAKKYSDKEGNPTGRYAQILSDRIKLDLQFRKQQQQVDDVTNTEIEGELFRAFQANPTAKNAEESQRMYVALTGKESVKLANAAKHLTYEAQHKKNVISAASKLRDFELTPEVVAGVCSIDPTGCKPIKDRADTFNAKWNSQGYKDSKKALDKLVSGTTEIGNIKAGSSEELRMRAYLHSQLETRTAQYEQALGFEGARLKAGKELEDEYNANYRNNVEGNKFFRKVTTSGVSYPYLPKGNVSAAESVRTEIADLRATSIVNGLDQAIANYFKDNPERLAYIKNNYDKPTFQPTPQELALKGFGNGMPLHTVYNKGFESSGDSTVLKSPLQSNGKDMVLTPAQLKIINDPLSGPQARLAVVRSVLNPTSFQDPGTMRPGSPIAQSSSSVAVGQTQSYTGSQKQFANTVYELAKKHGARHPEVAAAIASLETGYGRVQKDNNVFNLRAVGGGFEKFATLEDAVKRYIQLWDKNHSGYRNLESFADPNEAFAAIVNAYAPAADNNNPAAYKQFVADFIKSKAYSLK
jgi:hypothetical protein